MLIRSDTMNLEKAVETTEYTENTEREGIDVVLTLTGGVKSTPGGPAAS